MVQFAIQRLDRWVIEHSYRGYEPFDGLGSWLRPVALGRTGRQALMQSVLRSPVNIRPLLGVRATTSTKAHGFFARGYLKLFQTTGDDEWQVKAKYCLDWLRTNVSPNYPGCSWGNAFDYQSRAFYLPKGVPTVVWTALIGHAFVDAYEILGRAEDLSVAAAACRFILNGVERRDEKQGSCISYIPGSYIAIHNANALGAALLARVYRHSRDSDLQAVARDALRYTVAAQQPDGSWWYGEDPKYHWVDNWHTAYVLDSLLWYSQSTGDATYDEPLERGLRFWLGHFFLDDGTPRFYKDRTYPVDIQCAAQSIESLSQFDGFRQVSTLGLAGKVAVRTIRSMQDSDGHFVFRQWPNWTCRTPMIHWGQATMFHALSCLYARYTSSTDFDGTKIESDRPID